jgi:hypothetical protein
MTFPFTWKKEHSIVMGFLVCATIACVIVGGWISAYKDAAFDNRQKEYEGQLQILRVDREKAIARAELYEEKAKELEAQVFIAEAAIAAAGKRAEAIQEKIKDEDKEFTEAMQRVDTDFSPCTRIINICESAKRLGYLPKTHPCTCTDQ